MFGHMMRMVLGLGVIVGFVAYGWTTVLGMLNDVAIRDAGVPPKVWHAFKRYKPEGEIQDIRQVVEFMKGTATSGFPPSFLRGQFMEFCQVDVSNDSSHDLEACRECFNLLVDEVYAWKERQSADKTPVQAAASTARPDTNPSDDASLPEWLVRLKKEGRQEW